MNALPAIARRIGIGLVAVCAVLSSSSCAAGQHAHTANETPALDGSSAYLGAIQLHAVAILAPKGASYPVGSDAQLTLIIVNDGRSPDSLTQVSSPRFQSAQLPSSAAQRTIAAGQSVPINVANTGTDTSGQATLSLHGLTGGALFPGESVPVTFTFADAGTAKLTVPVQLSVVAPNASVPKPSGTPSLP